MGYQILKNVSPEYVEFVEQGHCPSCGEEISEDEFRDELSRKEYGISGLCQSCQDEIFTEKE